ncbi:hypothetical protein [Agitococcus lubricus]|uniref:Uncharacterized protein n=1 Tax=Agitococcus lubricus TaxID=1077255 RepID=A0A2T5IRW9_9GAMM|nr:hypothetical protein [Agitococcus lubricus]PTQ86563.1 hypothetical protein C8N29_13813 [Agitococcus lubricus]
MNNIGYLEKKIVEAKAIIQQQINSDDFFDNLCNRSMQSHIEDMESQLYQAKQLREKEVIEARLIGKLANHGTLPLDLHSKLAKYLSNTLLALSQRLEKGKDALRGFSKDITQTVNFRSAAMGAGSTRLYLTTDTNPDLFGRSLSSDSLEALFEFLHKANKNQDELLDMIAFVGVRCVNELAKLLHELHKNELALDLRWRSPNNTEHFWQGDDAIIDTLIKLISSVHTIQGQPIQLQGTIGELSDKGKIELYIDGVKTRFTYPRNMIEQIRMLHIGESINILASQTTHRNKITNQEKTHLELLSIN